MRVGSGSGNIAIGDHAVAAASNDGRIAIGARASASAGNTVAIGSHAIANEPNTFSVGAPRNTRRITNVTGGTADTDAVNVAQLKAAMGAMQAQIEALQRQTIASRGQ